MVPGRRDAGAGVTLRLCGYGDTTILRKLGNPGIIRGGSQQDDVRITVRWFIRRPHLQHIGNKLLNRLLQFIEGKFIDGSVRAITQLPPWSLVTRFVTWTSLLHPGCRACWRRFSGKRLHHLVQQSPHARKSDSELRARTQRQAPRPSSTAPKMRAG